MSSTDATDDVTASQGGATKWKIVQPWLSLAVRLAMGVIMIAAAIPKIIAVDESVRAVRAYRLLPEVFVPFVGTALPYFELVFGLVLIAGVFVRWSAILWLALMAVFVFGVAWAWAKGYSIDCGCFGGGGSVDPEDTKYLSEIIRDLGLFALGIYLYLYPKGRFALDK